MANVATNLDAEITSDGEHGATCHVLDKNSEEALGREISVVVLKELLKSLHELHGHQLESHVLEPPDVLTTDILFCQSWILFDLFLSLIKIIIS